jgi:hypothetical protein
MRLYEITNPEQLDEGMADKVKGAILGAAITFAAINTDLDKVFVEPVKGAIEQFKATDKQTKDTVAVVDPDSKSILNNWVERYTEWYDANQQKRKDQQKDKLQKEKAAKAQQDKRADTQRRRQAYKQEVDMPRTRTSMVVSSWSMDRRTNEYMPTAKFKVSLGNGNKYVAVKDFTLECSWYTKNDTKIATKRETIYESLDPGAKMDTEVEFHFPFSNRSKHIERAGCSLHSVEYHKTVRQPVRKYE